MLLLPLLLHLNFHFICCGWFAFDVEFREFHKIFSTKKMSNGSLSSWSNWLSTSIEKPLILKIDSCILLLLLLEKCFVFNSFASNIRSARLSCRKLTIFFVWVDILIYDWMWTVQSGAGQVRRKVKVKYRRRYLLNVYPRSFNCLLKWTIQ